MEGRNLQDELDEVAEGSLLLPLSKEELKAAISLLEPILFQTNRIQAGGEQMTPARRRQIAELVRIGQLQHLEQGSLELLETSAPDLAREHFQRLQMHACRLLWHIAANLKEQKEESPELRIFFIQNFTVVLRLIFDLEKPAFRQLPEIAPDIAPLFQILTSLAGNTQMEFSAFRQNVLPILKQINLRLRTLAITHKETRLVARKATRTARVR